MFITELFEAAQQQTLVIIPGGFHPFHPGHLSLYRSAQKAFPGATIIYAATDDQKERPFAFADKQKLATIAGVPEGAFQMVKSPFVAREITQNFDPNTTVLIFARSEKDRDEPPKPGGVKKNGEPSYLQPYAKGDLAPMSQHGYMAYLPTVQFDAGPSGVTSATQIRNMWPQADDAQKNAIISDLYPRNPAVARQILDKYLGGGLAEGLLDKFVKPKMKFNIETAGEELYVDVTLGGKQVAGFTFDMLGDDLEAQDISVSPEYRGQGIAQTVYDMLKAKGFRINRSQHQTDAGSHFWDKNKGAGSKVWEQDVAEGFDKEAFRQQMRDLEAREELRKTDPVSAKALDLRGQLPQKSKKKPEDDAMSINDPRHPNYAYTQAGHQGVAEETVDEKSVSKAQFRTMAAAAHNPKFAKKVGISQNVAQEFHHADKKQSYKSLPNKVDEDQDVLAQLDQLAESAGIL
jgi:GNAT superfamily N-acetyltransferase